MGAKLQLHHIPGAVGGFRLHAISFAILLAWP
jgi:hypothetical protein